jgi:hypothetical protein
MSDFVTINTIEERGEILRSVESNSVQLLPVVVMRFLLPSHAVGKLPAASGRSALKTIIGAVAGCGGILWKFSIALLLCIECATYCPAQPCGDVINCPDRKYRFFFCTPSGVKVECARNPWSYQQGWIPLHAIGRICLFLSPIPKYQPATTYVWPQRGGGEAAVFRPDLVNFDFDCAVGKWDCVCGKQQDPCRCRIEVLFVTDENDDYIQGYADRAIALAISQFQGNTCELNCEASPLNPGSKIVVNMTKRFMFPRRGRYPNIVYNDMLWDAVRNRASDTLMAWNLCEALIHEIGHLYGLGHHTDCPPASGIMNATAEANQPRRDLSQDDRCAYAKLYCPGIVPVDESRYPGNVVLYDGSIVVPLPPTITSGDQQFHLYDVLGRCYPVHAERNGDIVLIHTQHLSQGMYTLIIKSQQTTVRYTLIALQ